MAMQSNLTGRVVTWANNQFAVSTGVTPLAQFSFSMNAPSLPYLPDTSIGPRSAVAALASWTATISYLAKTPQIGNNGLVTFANGYVANVRGLDVTMNVDALDTTAFNATAPTWRTFIPGAYGWAGSYEGFLSSVTPMSAVGAACAAAAGTSAILQYGLSGATALALSGNIIPEVGGPTLADGSPNTYAYSFIGDAALYAKTGQSPFVSATATSAVVPTIGRLVLSAGDGTQLSGDAFPTSINIRSAVGDAVQITVTAQGSGDPNIS